LGYAGKEVELGTVLPQRLGHWAESDYGLSAGQHAVLPKGKGKGPRDWWACLWEPNPSIQSTKCNKVHFCVVLWCVLQPV